VRQEDATERSRNAEEQTEQVGNLSVRVESSSDGAAMTLRLSGHMDEAAAERLGRVRDAVVAHGCRELTLDVSDLSSATGDGLRMLLETARRVKESGGQFILVDSQGRFNRILRVFHLNRVLALGRDETPRRRAANLPIESPWKM
jgi:anti-anti-sigma factor